MIDEGTIKALLFVEELEKASWASIEKLADGGFKYEDLSPEQKVLVNYRRSAELVEWLPIIKARLGLVKSCRDCDWYDGYEGESCENPERAQCIDHSLFERRIDPPCEAVAKGPVDCDCDCDHCDPEK